MNHAVFLTANPLCCEESSTCFVKLDKFIQDEVYEVNQLRSTQCPCGELIFTPYFRVRIGECNTVLYMPFWVIFVRGAGTEH